MNYFRYLLNQLWEFPCPLCGCDNQHFHDFNSFCPDCLESLPLLHGKRCPGCGGELDGIFEQCSDCLKMPPRPWKHAMSVMKMTGAAEKAVYALKFGGAVAMARPIAELGAPLLANPDFAADIIVPVPLHWRRQLQRTYNQSALLAIMLSKKLNIPYQNALKRIRPTVRQATLSRVERLKNLRDAFAVPRPAMITGKKILLVDDVLTTGSTLHACAQTLLNAGAAEINVFTAARR